MAQNALHFGHKVAHWNPKMKVYLYGAEKGVHIFDLEKTAVHLQKLLDYLQKKADQGATILFVSTKPQTRPLFEELHKTTGMPVVSEKWIGGLLTNFSTIRERIKYLKSLREMFATGEIEKFTKKEQSKLMKEKEKLEIAFSGIAEMYRLPDAVFIVDGKRDEAALREANKLRIPVVGIADSNVDPDRYELFVPANDDAISSLTYLLSLIFDVVKSGKKKGKDLKPAPVEETTEAKEE